MAEILVEVYLRILLTSTWLSEERQVDKNAPLVHQVKEWVDIQYEDGRVTVITDNELVVVITDCCNKLGIVL